MTTKALWPSWLRIELATRADDGHDIKPCQIRIIIGPHRYSLTPEQVRTVTEKLNYFATDAEEIG